MLDDMRVNDVHLDASDIRQLENADEVAHFFAKLRYDVDQRTNILDYAMLGMGSDDMRQHIHKIELIAKDPEEGDISIYLFEVRSVTAKLRNDIARRFRERPQYEQAIADAKAQVVADEAITDDEENIEEIAAGILPAVRPFFERVEPAAIEALLDSELPNWRSLPPEAPTFLLTGDYNLRTLPDHTDFSTSVIPYTKAVEVVLSQRIFIPFRQHYTDADCMNDFLKKFMRGEKDLTLGSFMIILSSSRETALRNFISRIYTDAATRMFGAQGLVAILNDAEMRDIRNKAAHDEVLSRDEAQQTRAGAMKILEQV